MSLKDHATHLLFIRVFDPGSRIALCCEDCNNAMIADLTTFDKDQQLAAAVDKIGDVVAKMAPEAVAEIRGH